MTPVQKAMLHCELARKWSDGFFARSYIRMEWVAACQWHAFSNDRAGRRDQGPHGIRI